MDKAASRKRGIVFRVLTVLALVLLGAAYFQPGWWVSLTAPNYPEATFPQGIRILFHMDSVQNGCDIRSSTEVEETEALEAGCDDYDTKPVELPRLLGKIGRLVGEA